MYINYIPLARIGIFTMLLFYTSMQADTMEISINNSIEINFNDHSEDNDTQELGAVTILDDEASLEVDQEEHIEASVSETGISVDTDDIKVRIIE